MRESNIPLSPPGRKSSGFITWAFTFYQKVSGFEPSRVVRISVIHPSEAGVKIEMVPLIPLSPPIKRVPFGDSFVRDNRVQLCIYLTL